MARKQKILDGWKTCTDCDKTFRDTTDNFYKTGAGYLYKYCKSCFAIRQLEYKSKDKDKPRNRKQSTTPDENGNLTCRACLASLPANKDNFYIYKGKFIPECKICRAEYEKERYAMNKINDLRRNMMKKAAETGEELSQCLKCNQYSPVSSFREYDTNVYYQGKVLVKGYKYMCGVCWQIFHDATFALIPASYEIHKRKIGYVHKRKDRKGNKAKVS